MIKVRRGKVARPTILGLKDKNGMTERDRAIAFFSNPGNKKAKFSFTAYKGAGVRKALERLFGCKCAYCESKYEASQPAEVEHWRPKAAIEESDGTNSAPGYYWLAAEWTNLFPVCIDCNRRRWQVMPGGQVELVGKGNLFPLKKPKVRIIKPGKEKAEDPLLLNPCEDRPAEHLDFSKVITDAVVVAYKRADGLLSDKGVVSINTYGLNRHGLVQSRNEVMLQIRHSVQMIKQLARIRDRGTPGIGQADVDDLIDSELQNLARFTDPTHAYSLMGQQLIAVLMRDFTG